MYSESKFQTSNLLCLQVYIHIGKLLPKKH